MFEMNRKTKTILCDITIGLGILVLAFMLKDGDAESKNIGMITIIAAVLIRLSGSGIIGRNSEKDKKCNCS